MVNKCASKSYRCVPPEKVTESLKFFADLPLRSLAGGSDLSNGPNRVELVIFCILHDDGSRRTFRNDAL